MSVKLDSPWKEVKPYLRENGVTYPWDPRDTLKWMLLAKAWKAAALAGDTWDCADDDCECDYSQLVRAARALEGK